MAWTTPTTFVSGNVLTAAQMNTNVRDNTNALYDTIKRLGSVTATANVTVTSGSSSELFTDLTFTSVNGVAYRIEFYCGNVVTAASTYGEFKLTNGSGTVLSRIGTVGGTASEFVLNGVVYYTATGTSTTLNVILASGGGTTIARAGTGSGDVLPPMFLRVFGPDIT